MNAPPSHVEDVKLALSYQIQVNLRPSKKQPRPSFVTHPALLLPLFLLPVARARLLLLFMLISARHRCILLLRRPALLLPHGR